MTERFREAEVMDDLSLDKASLVGALRGLETINQLSLSARHVWRPISGLMKRTGKKRLKVLDIATGAGDIPIALWRMAQRANLDLELVGIDVNPKSLEHARENARKAGAAVEFRELNALEDQLPAGQDVVVSSLFLHHLDETPAVELLQRMAGATNHLVIVNDLRRQWWGHVLALVASRLLTNSPVVKVDAIRSVKAAFTIQEMRRLAQAAGLKEAQVSARWPCRFLMVWEKPQSSPLDE